MPNWGGGAKGAASGAAIGSAAGPWGAAIGAGIGGVAGLFSGGGDKNLEDYRRRVMERGFPQAPQAATTAGPSGFAASQRGLVNRLDDMSQGRGPSLAEAQLRSALDQNVSNQQSVAQSGRGNAALANIVAANNIGNLGARASQDAVAARISEQQMALGQLGQVVGQARGQDDAQSQFNAMQQNFRDQANLEAKLKAMGLDDGTILQIMNQQAAASQRPSTTDQLMSGAAGAASLYATQRAQANAYNAGRPGGGSVQMQGDFMNPYAR